MSDDPDYDAETREQEQIVLGIDYDNPANQTDEALDKYEWARFSRFVRYKVARAITRATMKDPMSQTSAPTVVHLSLLRAQVADFGEMPEEREGLMAYFNPGAGAKSFVGFHEARPEVMARFLPKPQTKDQSRDRLAPNEIPPTDKYQDARGEGHYTYGIKLQPFVALTWHSKPTYPFAADKKPFPTGDPHPNHPVSLPDTNYMTWEALGRNVVAILNATEKVVAILKDERENDPRRQLEYLFLETLNRGVDYDVAVAERLAFVQERWEDEYDEEPPDPPHMRPGGQAKRKAQESPTPKSMPFQFSDPRLADKAIRGLTNTIIFILTRPEYIRDMVVTGIPSELLENLPPNMKAQKLHEVSDKLITRAASGVPAYLAKRVRTNDFSAIEMAEIQKRIEHAVQANVLREQVDAHACNLPLMKPRYRAWSISRTPFWRFKNVKSSDYKGYRHPRATRPVDMYHWAALEVSSPVCQATPESSLLGLESLKVVCDTLRHSLRTHHCALPTLDGTTSIFIGHTEGFTLLELKKLVTLWFVIEPRLRHIHRHHRNTLEGQWTCMPLRYGSRLGALANVPLNFPLFDTDGIMPHPSVDTRDFFTDQMNSHFAMLPFFATLSDGDELYLRSVWQYTSVSDLSLAMETIGAPECTALAIRCHGRGQRTSRLRSTKQILYEANRPEDIFPGEIDMHRGVIEFRQMGQNLDPDSIWAWREICGVIVQACRETNSVCFREMMHMFYEGKNKEYSAWDILGVRGPTREIFGREERDAKLYYQPRRNGTVQYKNPFYHLG
ncbi:hypothetical protein F5Y12DRAFT_719128 [Xylaria sp. FL1777]|nr:hypothetical protein F5Y12DRAFT_719128 [Xylaria sp. FL1777]